MQILLHDDVAAAGEPGVLSADQRRIRRFLTGGVLRAVDESDHVAVVEILEAMHLVYGGHRLAEPRHELCRQLETQVHPRATDMEEDVPGRGDRMARFGVDFPKRMQLRRALRPEQAIPGGRAKPHHAGQVALQVAEGYGADKPREVITERPDRRARVITRVDRDDEKDGGSR